MRRLIFVGLAFLLAGCSEEKKLESICTDIVRSVAIDPSSVKINSVKMTEGALREDSLKRHFDDRYPDGLTKDGEALFLIRKKELGESRNIFTQVDYTASARIGVTRDRALCRFFKWKGGETELVSITIRNRDYSQKKLFDIFLQYGRPDGLSSLYRVK